MFNSQNVITCCSFTFGAVLKRKILLIFWKMSCCNQSATELHSAECFSFKHRVATSQQNIRPRHYLDSDMSVYNCWQCLLSHFLLDRREAVLLPSLQQGVCGQVQSQGSPTDPFGCEKIPVQELLQNLLQDVSSAQAWGIWLLCSTLNWDTLPPTRNLFFPGPGELSGNHIERGGLVPKYADFFLVHCISEWEMALSLASRFKQCFCDCNQCQDFVISCTHLPVLFMHFLHV